MEAGRAVWLCLFSLRSFAVPSLPPPPAPVDRSLSPYPPTPLSSPSPPAHSTPPVYPFFRPPTPHTLSLSCTAGGCRWVWKAHIEKLKSLAVKCLIVRCSP